MSNELLVKVENVSKKFCRDLKKSLWYGLRDIAGEITGRNNHNRELRPKEFWALKDISFELRRGEVLGLIGRNGAGKTTLLRVLNNLIKPDTGRVTMKGRVGALIALGAGFNPILTGRENVYVNGAVLGLTKKEIDAKFDEIVDFAELWEFIDTPVQSYSSGMQVRLGFAVATALKPDVLLLDEVLAVGDAAFRTKCYERIGRILNDTAVIFVSHYMEHVSMICNRILMIQKGFQVHLGEIGKGITMYNRESEEKTYRSENFLHCQPPIFNGNVKFDCLELKYGEDLHATINLETRESMRNISLRIVIYDLSGQQIGEWGNMMNSLRLNLASGLSTIRFSAQIQLRPGSYDLSVCLANEKKINMQFWSHKQHRLTVRGSSFGFSVYQIVSSNCRIEAQNEKTLI